MKENEITLEDIEKLIHPWDRDIDEYFIPTNEFPNPMPCGCYVTNKKIQLCKEHANRLREDSQFVQASNYGIKKGKIGTYRGIPVLKSEWKKEEK